MSLPPIHQKNNNQGEDNNSSRGSNSSEDDNNNNNNNRNEDEEERAPNTTTITHLPHLPNTARNKNTASTASAGGGSSSSIHQGGSQTARTSTFYNNNNTNTNNQQLPFDVTKTADGVHLPATAWIPRENTKEEHRRLKLLELYWDNSNPHLAGYFSEAEPVDRMLARQADLTMLALNATHGSSGGSSSVANQLKESVFLQGIPRSSLQRRLAELTWSDVQRHKNMKNAARRLVKLHKQQDDTDSDDDEEKYKPESEHEQVKRKQTEKERRTAHQEKRREELRKRFYRGDTLDDDDYGAQKRALRLLEETFDVGLAERRRRAANQRSYVSREAQAMREQAEERRRLAARRQEENAEARRRALSDKKSQRHADSQVDRERREWLQKKKLERDSQREEAAEKKRLREAAEERKKREKELSAREAARKKAEELSKERDRKARERADREQRERERREKEEEDELKKALQRKKSMSHPEPKYKHAGPTDIPVNSRKVYEALEEGQGQLFRIVETDPSIKGKRWHFYNDTERTTFHIKVFFVPPCSVRAIGDAVLEEDEFEGERGEVVIALKVPPLKTLSFSEGQVKAFSAEIEAEDQLSSPDNLSPGGSASFGSAADDQEGQVPLAYPIFKNGAPEGIEAPYEVYECFQGEGILFRIVKRNFPSEGMQQWWYYNDDTEFGMKIECKFGSRSDISALGEAKKTTVENGLHLVKAEVACLKTIPFIKGKTIAGFTQDFDVIEPDYNNHDDLSPARPKVDYTRRKSMSGAERRKLIKELQSHATDLVEKLKEFAAAQKIENADSSNAQNHRLLLACLKNKHFFVDLQFPPILSSVSTDEDQLEELDEVCWLKAQEFVKQSQVSEKIPENERKKPQPVHGGTVNASDIVPGAITDWWILSAIGVLAHNPARITSLFKNHPLGPAVEKKEVAQGIYRIRMLVGGWWEDVIVDDWMPVEIDAKGVPAIFFATSKNGPHELWPALIEKAYAKVSYDKCYTELGNGDSLHVIEDLTGFPSVRLDPRLEGEEELDGSINEKEGVEGAGLFRDFKAYLERNWIVVLNTSQPPEDDEEFEELEKTLTKSGLEVDATYKVVDCKDFTHLGTTYRLCKISNPWKKGTEWKGAWSWGHPEWKRIPTAARLCEIPGAVPIRRDSNSNVNNNNNNNNNNSFASSSNPPPPLPGFSVTAASGGDGGAGAGGGLDFAIPTINVGGGGGDESSSPKKAPAAGKKGGKQQPGSPTKPAKEKVSPEDGTFWMEWKDVKKHFTGAGVCYTQSDWHDYRVQGKFENGHPSIGLEVRCNQKTRAFLLLMQSSEHGFDSAHPDSKYAGALLSLASRREDGDYAVTLNSDLYFDKPSTELTFVVGRSLGFEYTFEASEEDVHLIIPRSFSKTCNKDYVLAVICDSPVGDETISFRFKNMKPELGIFDNMPFFTYVRSKHTEELDVEFTYRPPNGRPQRNTGTEFEGAPSDLVAGRVSRMGGGATPSASGSYGMENQQSLALSPHSASFKNAPVGTMRPVSSMSFDIVTDVLVHLRSSSELPFDVNSIAVYDFRGTEVFRSVRLIKPATNRPSWSHSDKAGEGSSAASFPLAYLWNNDVKNLTFKLLYVNEETGDSEVKCEGKSSWDDATVAAKLSSEPNGSRPIVALRLRTPTNAHRSSGDPFAKEVVGSLSVAFSSVTRTQSEKEASYFSLTFISAARLTEAGAASGGGDGNEKTHIVIRSASEREHIVWQSGDSMPATAKEVMFMGSCAETVLHAHGTYYKKGFVMQLANMETGRIYAEAEVQAKDLVGWSPPASEDALEMSLSGSGREREDATVIELKQAEEGLFHDEKAFVKCHVQSFKVDHY